MKTSLFLTTLFAVALIALSSFAQPPATSPAAAGSKVVNTGQVAVPAQPATGQPSAADMEKMMQQMMELSKLNENHKLLAGLDGTWSYTVKMWMTPDPNAKPQESKGTAVRKSMMDGRFFVMDVSGKMQMPGADGKPKDMEFKGMGIEGYDNVKKKFVGTWVDNMGTGIMMSEGTYDPATKTFIYTGEYEAIPGMKQKIREVVKIADKDHMSFEWYENQGGQEKKTMEIAYTRKK
ncbi:MAG TPA: DUF1579 domain-containing protein [Chthoniobacterales bacterium]|nr:DUF1579 domain-containing protein [Chthoniobacterales bacterium]